VKIPAKKALCWKIRIFVLGFGFKKHVSTPKMKIEMKMVSKFLMVCGLMIGGLMMASQASAQTPSHCTGAKSVSAGHGCCASKTAVGGSSTTTTTNGGSAATKTSLHHQRSRSFKNKLPRCRSQNKLQPRRRQIELRCNASDKTRRDKIIVVIRVLNRKKGICFRANAFFYCCFGQSTLTLTVQFFS
jgi:hypothetical protein